MATNRNSPSSTAGGMYWSGIGNISRDSPIKIWDTNPDSLVSRTLTMLMNREVCMLDDTAKVKVSFDRYNREFGR